MKTRRYTPRQNERGQILALGAVALIALTAIAAAAIDTDDPIRGDLDRLYESKARYLS